MEGTVTDSDALEASAVRALYHPRLVVRPMSAAALTLSSAAGLHV